MVDVIVWPVVFRVGVEGHGSGQGCGGVRDCLGEGAEAGLRGGNGGEGGEGRCW